MTFNSSQQERLLAALERIADALDRGHPDRSKRPEPPEGMTWDDVREVLRNPPLPPQRTKGPNQ